MCGIAGIVDTRLGALAACFQGRRDHSPRIWRRLMFKLSRRNVLYQLKSVAPAQPLVAAVSLPGSRG